MSIEVQNLSFSYCTHAVLKDIDFSVDNGKLLAILGPNGVGKTTLFRCILGLHTKYKGIIKIDGQISRELTARELAHRIAYIPQIHAQTFGYSVLEMVLMGTNHSLSSVSIPGQKERDCAMTALERLGIDHLAHKNFNHLSGGEQQLTLIARALAQNAKTLLMDEPTAALDYGNQSHVLSAVRSLASDGFTVIMTTHNPQQAFHYADLVLAISDGRIAGFGTPRDVLTEALIKKLYNMDVKLIESEIGPIITPVILKAVQ